MRRAVEFMATFSGEGTQPRWGELQNYRTVDSSPRVERPLDECFVRQKLIRGLEKRLNQLWYHLYRAVTETRLAIAHGKSPPDQETLAEYARRALQLSAQHTRISHGLVEELNLLDSEEQQLKAVESEVKRLDEELNQVVFLDELDIRVARERENSEYQMALQNKYRRWALELLELAPARPHNLENTHISSNNQRAPRARSGLAHRDGQAREDKSRQGSSPILRQHPKQPKKVSDIVLGKLRPDQEVPQPASLPKPTTEHMAITTLTQKMMLPLKTAQIIRQRLHSKTPAKTARPTQPSERAEPFEPLHQLLDPLEHLAVYHTARTNAQPETKVGSYSAGRSTRSPSTKRTATPQRRISQFKATQPVRTDPRGTKDQQAKAPGSSRNSPATQTMRRCQTSIQTRRKKPQDCPQLDRLLLTCATEQQASENDLQQITQVQRDIKSSLEMLHKRLPNHFVTQDYCDEQEAQQVKKQKHLFVYGKRGLGRFLTAEAKDLVKLSDMLTKINPKYPFLSTRLSDLLAKQQ